VSTAWKPLTLGDIAKFVRGINFKPDDVVPTGTAGSVSCMRTKNVQAELDLSDVWSVGQQFVRREDQFLQMGDVLVSSANSWNLLGKCCWVPELPARASFGGFVSVLRADRAKVEPRFLFRWFSSDRIQTTLRSFGQQTTNISNLNIERCLNLPLTLPPLAEQRRIADALDLADVLRARRRAGLAQLDYLTQSIFLSLFGDPVSNPKQWPNPSLGGLLSFQQYGPRFYNESYSDDGIKIVRITDLSEAGNLNFSAMPKLVVSDRDREKYALRSGDLIFARTGATVGKVALIRPDDPPCIAGAYFITMRFKEALEPLYARAVLTAPSVRAIVARRSRQAAQQNFSGPGLRRLPMPLPPVELQREFALRVHAVEKVKSAHRASLAQMDALFASLQYRAFRGEL
jgi:type I restriction enzyme S subunit